MKLPIRRLTETATLPTRAHPDDAGLDLRADLPSAITIESGQWYLVPTGVAVAIPPGHVGLVCPRSGLALVRGVTVGNSPGVVDAGYRGLVMVNLINHGSLPYTINPGDRIAQLLIIPIPTIETEEVETLDDTERGTGGHGSTGA